VAYARSCSGAGSLSSSCESGPVVAEGDLPPPQPATTMHATTPAIDAISLRERRLTDARRKR